VFGVQTLYGLRILSRRSVAMLNYPSPDLAEQRPFTSFCLPSPVATKTAIRKGVSVNNRSTDSSPLSTPASMAAYTEKGNQGCDLEFGASPSRPAVQRFLRRQYAS